MFTWESRIRFVDTDASGRIHYTALFRHFEAAEDEFMRSIGHPYQDIEASALSYPRVHVECDYRTALRADDIIRTEVLVERVGNTSFTLRFEARHRNQVAAAGRIVVVCMNRHTQRSHPLPLPLADSLRERLIPTEPAS